MIEIEKKCPKCNDDMVKGFTLDFSSGAIIVPAWHEGSPKASFWGDTSAPDSVGIPIAAFRCPGCGFVEFYAQEQFKAV
jgi:hypothetical protein